MPDFIQQFLLKKPGIFAGFFFIIPEKLAFKRGRMVCFPKETRSQNNRIYDVSFLFLQGRKDSAGENKNILRI